MQFNYEELRGLIKTKFGSEKAFAEAMKLPQSTISMRLSSKTPWRLEEIPRACELLDIPPEKIAFYFFTQKVR